MARVIYFNGELELTGIHGMRNVDFAGRFPLVVGKRFDSFSRLVGYAAGSKTALPVERVVEFKSSPSPHKCDDRCINAAGKIMRCECSCGGKNHGSGAFNCTAEAA